MQIELSQRELRAVISSLMDETARDVKEACWLHSVDLDARLNRIVELAALVRKFQIGS